jgi:hypothetical protein
MGVWLAGGLVGMGDGTEVIAIMGEVPVADGLTGRGAGVAVVSGRQACSSRLPARRKEIANRRGLNHMDAILLQRKNSFAPLHLGSGKDIMCQSGTDFATEVYDFTKT